MTEEIQPGGLEIRGVEGSVQRHRRELTWGRRQKDGGQGMDERGQKRTTRTYTSTHLTYLEGRGGCGFLEDRSQKPWWATETMAALQRAWGLQEG